MLTTTNPTVAEQARLCELADQKEAEKRQFLAIQRSSINYTLMTHGIARENGHLRPAAEALMLDVVDQPESAQLRLLCELYAMVARGDSVASIGGAFVEFVRGNVLGAAENAWQAREDGEGGRVFIPGVRHG